MMLPIFNSIFWRCKCLAIHAEQVQIGNKIVVKCKMGKPNKPTHSAFLFFWLSPVWFPELNQLEYCRLKSINSEIPTKHYYVTSWFCVKPSTPSLGCVIRPSQQGSATLLVGSLFATRSINAGSTHSKPWKKLSDASYRLKIKKVFRQPWHLELLLCNSLVST